MSNQVPVTCQVCGRENMPGALVCAECHNILVRTSLSVQSTTLPPAFGSGASSNWRPRPTIDVDAIPSGSIGICISGAEEPIIVPFVDQIIFGRQDNERGKHNTINLTEFGASSLGVSRIHGTIRRAGRGYTFEDMSSTNGSWLNDIRMQPYIAGKMRSGDVIRLGQLEIQVFFND